MSEIAAQIASESVAAPAETPAAPAASSPPPEQGEFASKFAALSKREKRIQDQLNELKTSKSEMERFSTLKERAKENPLSVLDEYGLTLEQLLTHSLGADAPPMTESDRLDSLKKEIEALRAEQLEQKEAEKKLKETEEQSRIEEAILSHRFKIEEEVSKNSDKYELLNIHGESALDLVWEVTEQYFEQHNKVLTPTEAAEKVEAYLEGEARKMLGVKKLRPTETSKQGEGLVERQLNPLKQNFTLSQEMQAPPQQRPYTPVDIEESKARAAAMLRWT